MRRLVTLAIALIVALGCGDGDDDLTAAEQEYVDARMAEFDPAQAAPLTRDDARCLVEETIRTLGVARLRAADVTPEEFAAGTGLPEGSRISVEDAEALVDGLDECMDLIRFYAEDLVASAPVQLDDDAADCLRENLDDDLVRQILVRGFAQVSTEEQEFIDDLQALFEACPQVADAIVASSG
jgi:hypothetical protein